MVGKSFHISMGAHTLMDDVDWFLWEPVESAHIFTDDSLEKLSKERLDEIIVPKHTSASAPLGDKELCIRAPVGRYNSATFEVRVPLPATRGQILRALWDFYRRPVTPDVLQVMRRAGAMDSDYAHSAQRRLDAGKTVTLLELCGSANDCSSMLATETRRDPLNDCMGAVRFEGLQGDASTCTYDLVVGS